LTAMVSLIWIVILLLNHVDNPVVYEINERTEEVNCNDAVNMGDVILLLNHVNNPTRYKIGLLEWCVVLVGCFLEKWLVNDKYKNL